MRKERGRRALSLNSRMRIPHAADRTGREQGRTAAGRKNEHELARVRAFNSDADDVRAYRQLHATAGWTGRTRQPSGRCAFLNGWRFDLFLRREMRGRDERTEGPRASYREMQHSRSCTTRPVTRREPSARPDREGREVSGVCLPARVCVRARCRGRPLPTDSPVCGDGVIPGATPTRTRSRTCTLLQAPLGRPTDRTNDRPTNPTVPVKGDCDSTPSAAPSREWRGREGEAPILADGAGIPSPLPPQLSRPARQLVESRRRGSRQFHASLARWRHRTDAPRAVARSELSFVVTRY